MSSLLQKWKSKKRAQEKDSLGITKASDSEGIPLSYGQEQLWFLQQLYPDNPFYNYCEVYVFEGLLNVSYFKEALERVLNDHDVLKSIYQVDHAGNTIQKVKTSLGLNLTYHDWSNKPEGTLSSELRTLGLEDASTHFSLLEGPLYKFSLIKCAEDKHQLYITLNHLITDKWSMMIFRNHLSIYYNQLNKGQELSQLRPKIQYLDYAYHQKKMGLNSKQLAYWKRKLENNNPDLAIPTDHKRPTQLSFKGKLHTALYTRSFSQEVLDLSRKMQATPYVVILGAYYVLLHILSSQTRIAIGSPVANRNEKELESVIGFFNDTIVLQTEIDRGMSFSEFISEVRKTSLEAFENKDIPFSELVKELKPERKLNMNPFFQAMFIYHKVPEKPSFGNDLKIQHKPSEVGVAKFDLTLYIAEEDETISSTMEYSSDLFNHETIEKFQEQLQQILFSATRNPELALSELINDSQQRASIPVHKDDRSEQEQPGFFNDLNENGIHGLIERMALQFPTKTAVTFGEHSITYEDLLLKSNKIAQKVLEKTMGENQIVGLCLNRSIELVVGIMGILRAGCAYLPIDPNYPEKRVDFMFKDSGANYVLVDQENLSEFDSRSVTTILFNLNEKDEAEFALPSIEENHLAYVIYTSGSTGNPKGVPITHKNIVHSTMGRLDFYEKQPNSFLLLSSIAFDSSKAGLFWTLCTGGNLVVSENRIEQDIHKIGEIIERHGVTHTLMLPTLYELILEHVDQIKLQSLDTVMVAGESCSSRVVKKHFEKLPKTRMYNEYGPTEGTVWCIAHKVEPQDSNAAVPIGKAVAGAKIHLLNEELEEVPKGTIGQIYVGGPGLSSSYLNRPDLSNKVYIQSPFSQSPNERLYRTGDMGKRRDDGSIIFVGRSDQQVKIRGHRIEVGEIEKALLSVPGIDNAVVVVSESVDSRVDNLSSDASFDEILTLMELHLSVEEIENLLSTIQA